MKILKTNLSLSIKVDFNNTSDKVDFINAIQFLTNDNLDSFIEKIKEEQCTQATISFPTIY